MSDDIYPSGFPPESRARVEAEKIRAGRDFETAKQTARWTSNVEAHLRQYILRVFFVFANEACSRQLWAVDKIDRTSREFLRRLTIEAYYEKGYDQQERRLSEMISNAAGSILPKVQREFDKSPEWHQFQEDLLTVAEAAVLAKAPGASEATTPKRKRVPKGRGVPRRRRPATLRTLVPPYKNEMNEPSPASRERGPDLAISRERVGLEDRLREELATINATAAKYPTLDLVKKAFPDFGLWAILSPTEQKTLLSEPFKPRAYARALVARKYGLTSTETIKKDRQKVRRAHRRRM